MEKLISVIRRAPGTDVPAFRTAFWAHVDQSAAPGRRLVSFPDCTPEQCAQPGGDGYPAFDAVEERWFGSRGELERYCREFQAPGWAAEWWHYHVAEYVRKDERPSSSLRQRAPGVKQIYLTRRAPGQDHTAFVRHWREVHGPLALRVHFGMSRYVQNVVIDCLSRGAPEVDGVPELHFASLGDARTKRYVPEGGRAAIAADRPNFVSHSTPLFCGEYLVSE